MVSIENSFFGKEDVGQPLSHPLFYSVIMTTHFSYPPEDRGTLIATFGRARLMKKSESAFVLDGGSTDDHAEAREWISLFMHEAVIKTNAEATARRGRTL
jgi:hypothetical protein